MKARKAKSEQPPGPAPEQLIREAIARLYQIRAATEGEKPTINVFIDPKGFALSMKMKGGSGKDPRGPEYLGQVGAGAAEGEWGFTEQITREIIEKDPRWAAIQIENFIKNCYEVFVEHRGPSATSITFPKTREELSSDYDDGKKWVKVYPGEPETLDEFAAIKGFTVAEVNEIVDLYKKAEAELVEVVQNTSPGYTREDMHNNKAATLEAAATLLSTIYPNERVEKALEHLAAEAARETTSPATAEPRPEDASGSAFAPRIVTAQELFGNVPRTFQVKAHQKYEFAAELLDDHQAFKRAEKIANARSYRIYHKGKTLTADEDAQGLLAAAFVSQYRRRHGLTKPRSRRRVVGATPF